MSDLAIAMCLGSSEPDLDAFVQSFDDAAELVKLIDAGILWVPRARLPERLRSIHEPPRGLFVRTVDQSKPVNYAALLDGLTVAVVGARACTDYGAHVARTASRGLAELGATVVSGLARGVDGWAHRGALERDPETWEHDLDGRMIAVLGCGIDVDYPRAHASLAADITRRGGLIVSEYPPGVPPAPWRFPARNRIIAGLSRAVLVVEARERSGSLITADLALEEGREVWAVPGEITSSASAGSNHLLQRGASAFTSASDVIDALLEEEAERRSTSRDDRARISQYDRERVGQIVRGEGDWFSAHLLRLIHKADRPNRAALAEVYPDHVAAHEAWMTGAR